jgi:hypothetical protein
MIHIKRWQNKHSLLIASLMTTAVALPAHALKFSMGDVDGSLSSNLTVGASWRVEGIDYDLVSPGNTEGRGRASASVTDDGNLNFEKGHLFSLIFKGRHDLELSYENFGAFTRVRYWYDRELDKGDRPHGNSLNGYEPNEPLDDSRFSDLAKSSGLELLDAYIYGSFDVAGTPLDVRLGRQVVSWGESTFIQNSINSINPVDVSALRKPGSELKEALLPVGMIYIGAGLTDALSMEMFYQYEWKKTELDGCGNYFADVDVAADGCNVLTAFNFASDKDLYEGNWENPILALLEAPGYVPRAKDIEASDSGQYGIAFRYFADSLNSTEFGFFYMNYHSRTPIFSGINGDIAFDDLPSTLGLVIPPLLVRNGKNDYETIPHYVMEFPEDIKLYGLSFNTNVAGWAVSGEISHRPKMPLAINTTEIVHAIALGPQAPWSKMYDRAKNAGANGIVHGYDEVEFTQIQFTVLKFFDRILGANRLTFVGEIGANHIGGLPDTEKMRYGRSPTYGIGEFTAFSSGEGSAIPGQEFNYTCSSSDAALIGGLLPPNTQSQNCTDDGYITSNAWGYRMILALDYSDVFAGVNLTPILGWSHDVNGYAPPPNFNEGNKSLNLGLRADYLHTYTAEISYTQFSGGDYNTLNDRDFASISFGVNF